MKHILVPTDFSDEAENALRVAVILARKHKAKIYLLHMLEIPMQQIDPINAYANVPETLFFMKLAHKKLVDLKKKEFLQDIEVQEVVEADITFNEIEKTCKTYGIELIVMGSHGASGFKEMFVGSNAEKVVRTSEVPVLVIKNKHDNFDVKTFVFASDFKKDKKESFKQVTQFVKIFNAKIHLLMVNTASNFITTDDANRRIQSFIADTCCDNCSYTIHNDISIEMGILNYARDVNADLIGISTHGRQGIIHFLSGSISEDVVNHSKTPVITFKI